MFAPRFRAVSFASCALALSICCSLASPAQQAAPYQPPPDKAPAVLPDSLAWLPPGVAALGHQASSHTDFSFDRSILGLVGNMTSLDEPTRNAIARLNGIALHVYHFPERSSYDPASLEAIRTEYGELGWKHFFTTKTAATPLTPGGGRTDVWINTQGINVAGAVILLAGPTTVDLVSVSGDLSTLDLLRLRGHFGIPRFPDDALPH